MRADRLLSILLMLQTQGRLTARELAERLEVSERTIHRDMESLSTAGVPVMAERGAGGGWALLDSYRTDLTGLKPAEIQAIFLTPSTRLLDDLGLRGAADGALIKLLAALPSIHRHDAEFARQHIYVDGAGWRDRSEDAVCLPTLQEAIWAGRKVVIAYQRPDAPAVERVVDPLGLVAKGGAWYLVGSVDGDLRTYRVSRVETASVSTEVSIRPEGFDLGAYWKQSAAEFKANLPRYPATLRVHHSIVWRMSEMRFARVENVEPVDADGWQEVSMLFEVIEYACESVLNFGPLVEILEPAELRARVIEQAAGIVALYERKHEGE